MRKSIKLVKQPEKEEGCGIACVSVLTGKSYDSLKEELKKIKCWTKRKKVFRTQPDDLSSLLEKIGIGHEEEKFKSIELVPHPAIIAVNNEKGKFHWVFIFSKNGRTFIVDTEYGELYRYENYKSDYIFYKSKSCIVFPGLVINSVRI